MTRTRSTGRIYQPHYRHRRTGELRTAATWAIRYYDRRIRKHVDEYGFPHQTAAERMLRQRLSDLDRGRAVGPRLERTRLEELLKLVEADYKANQRRPERLSQSLAHVRRFFGSPRALDVTSADATRYVAHRLDEGAARATVNRELSALKRALRLGRRAGLLQSVPDIPLLREDNVRKGFFDEGQVRSLLAKLPKELRPVIQVAYITGWRVPSEILTRQWRHVDFEGGWLRLEPGEAKNKEGRAFPLDPQLRPLLLALRKRTTALERGGRIIPWVFHRAGEPIRTMRRAWLTACRKAGIPGRLLHDFRRTAVRNLERAGVPRSTAMALVGHRTEAIYRRYAITDEAMLREGALRLPTTVLAPSADRKRR